MEILVENTWVSEIRTPKMLVIVNCEKNIWASEIRTPKIPGHRKSRQNIWVSEFWHGSIT